jgi:hypothetical protein
VCVYLVLRGETYILEKRGRRRHSEALTKRVGYNDTRHVCAALIVRWSSAVTSNCHVVERDVRLLGVVYIVSAGEM